LSAKCQTEGIVDSSNNETGDDPPCNRFAMFEANYEHKVI